MTLEERNEFLKAAQDLVRKGWCQGAWARREDGSAVDATDVDAVSFCLSGALNRIWRKTGTPPSLYFTVSMAVHHVIRKKDAHILSEFNDAPDRTQAEVIELFDEAMKEPL